jgi:hypothetical protein
MHSVDIGAAAAYTSPTTRLKNRAVRSGVDIRGWVAVALGALFLVGGATVLVLDADTTLANPVGHPLWWLAAYGVASVAFAGVAALVRGGRDVRRASRAARRRAAHPHEPWRWDYEWDEHGARDDFTTRRARQYIIWSVVTFSIAGTLVWLALMGPPPGAPPTAAGQIIVLWLPLGAAIVFISLIALQLLTPGLELMQRRLKYGPGTATFARFPFRRGEQLELRVRAPRSLPRHAAVTATLRCIQERYVTTERQRHEPHTQCFELCRDTAPAEHVATGAGHAILRVRFDIPRDAPVTDLTSRPCRYWEVDIDASTDGVDYAARYLVPVY